MPSPRERSALRLLPLPLVLLSACGSDPAAPATPPGHPAGAATVAVKGWPAGQTGTLRFYRNVFGGALLAEVPIDGAGRASYALPAPPGLFAFTPSAGLTISPPEALHQTIIAINTVPAPGTSETGQVRLANGPVHPTAVAGDVLVELLYVDRDVSITGTSGGCTYNQHFEAGWNFSSVEILAISPEYACRVTSSTTLPPGIEWHYVYLGL